MSNYKYFRDEEIKNLDLEFVAMLDNARHVSGVPYTITSGYRTPEENFEVGGVDASAHTKGLAVDLRCQDTHHLGLILKGLYAVGFNRIGIYFANKDNKPWPSHVHVDNAKDRVQDVVWLKLEGHRDIDAIEAFVL